MISVLSTETTSCVDDPKLDSVDQIQLQVEQPWGGGEVPVSLIRLS